jgi:hypothetical protein
MIIASSASFLTRPFVAAGRYADMFLAIGKRSILTK